MRDFKIHIIAAFLLFGVSLLTYSSAFKNSFVYDDHFYVKDNVAIRNLGFKGIISDFVDNNALSSNKQLSGNSWRPLMIISLAIDYKLWGLNPHLSRAENVMLHCLIVILVYFLAALLFDSYVIAFISSLVFAVHPVQTEAVTWITGRSNQLFLLFFISALIFHVRNRKVGQGGVRYSLSLILFTCSLLSKEMAITLPLIMMLYDASFAVKKSLKDRLIYYAPFFLVAIFYLLARYSVLGSIAHKELWVRHGVLADALVIIQAIAGYLRLLLLPVNLRLSYDVTMLRAGTEAAGFISILALAAAGILWFGFRKNNKISFCFGWFFITLIPVYNVVPLALVMAERFLYLPSIAFAFLMGICAYSVYRKFEKNRRMAIGLIFSGVAIIVFYAQAVVARNEEWRNDISLFKAEVLRSPNNPMAHLMLGLAYSGAAKSVLLKEKVDAYYKSSAEELAAAISLNPDFQAAYWELANTYSFMGAYNIAADNYKKAISLGENSDIYNCLGIAYCRLGMYDEAAKVCKRAICMGTASYYPYVNLGNAYFGKREYAKANKAWLAAVRRGGALPALIKQIKDLPK